MKTAALTTALILLAIPWVLVVLTVAALARFVRGLLQAGIPEPQVREITAHVVA